MPDGFYFARLAPSTYLDFIGEDFDPYRGHFRRVNYKADILGAIGGLGGFWQNSAYGHLRSNRDRFETHSQLTSFLKMFHKFKPHMNTERRERVATELISIHPLMVVKTIWIGYSRLQGITVLRGMSNFPRRTDASYEPYVTTRDGEEIRALPYVDGCWTVKEFLISVEQRNGIEGHRQDGFGAFEADFDPMEALNNARAECRERGHDWRRETWPIAAPIEYFWEWCPTCGAERSRYSDRDAWHQWPKDEKITAKTAELRTLFPAVSHAIVSKSHPEECQ